MILSSSIKCEYEPLIEILCHRILNAVILTKWKHYQALQGAIDSFLLMHIDTFISASVHQSELSYEKALETLLGWKAIYIDQDIAIEHRFLMKEIFSTFTDNIKRYSEHNQRIKSL